MGIGYDVLVIFALTLANAAFAGSEIALLAVRKTRLQELAAEGSAGARAALKLRENPERFLATIQVGITVIGATAGAFGGATLEEPVEVWLEALGFGDLAAELSLTLVVVLVSFLSIVVGELVPKSLALRYSGRFSTFAAPVIAFLAACAKPIIWFLTQVSNLLLRPFGDQTTFTEARLSAEELQQLVEEAAASGSVHPKASAMASAAMDLAAARIMTVMVPRQEVVALSVECTAEEFVERCRKWPHSRYPVLDVDDETPLGYVLAREVLISLVADQQLRLHGLLRPVPHVPEFASALDVFRLMQQEQQPFCLVVDEHGGFSGVLSIEDILEEVTGEILDEHEIPVIRAWRDDDGAIIALGTAPVRQLNREFGLDLPDGPKFSTIAGYALQSAGRMPRAGECLESDGRYRIEILEATQRRIARVRIRGFDRGV